MDTRVEPKHELHHRHPRALDAVPRNPAIDIAPPVSPNMVRAPEAKGIRQNFVETLVFKGLASPLALVLVVVQSRYLHTSGRGSYVLVILSVTILTRLLGQLGYAVTNRAQKKGRELRPLVQASFAIGIVLGVLGTAAIIAWGAASPDIGLRSPRSRRRRSSRSHRGRASAACCSASTGSGSGT